jgi:hypothetical protein
MSGKMNRGRRGTRRTGAWRGGPSADGRYRRCLIDHRADTLWLVETYLTADDLDARPSAATDLCRQAL